MITTVFQVTTVDRDQLLTSAKDFADRALKAYTEEDTKVILTNAAIGLEHLCKAYLCDLHPALLMDIKNGQLDSLLHLTGHRAKAKDPGKGPRTISGRTAVERVQSLMRGLKVPQDQVKQLIDVRDGIVHVGYLQPNATRELLSAYLRLSNEIYDALQVGDDRWGRHKDLVESMISETLNEVQQEVRRRIAKAKHDFDELMEKIPGEHHAAVLKSRHAQAWAQLTDRTDEIEVTCPACGSEEAYCFGTEDVDVDVEHVSDGEGGYMTVYHGGRRFLQVATFGCGACGLKLRDADEVVAAGLELTPDYPVEEEDWSWVD